MAEYADPNDQPGLLDVLDEDDRALIENALVCYAEQLRVSEGAARMALPSPGPVSWRTS